MALLTRTLRVMKSTVDELEPLTTEHSAKYESQSNGATEVAIRAVRGLFRTLRLCLEGRIGFKIPDNHPLVPWLLEHTALLLNITTRGEDGLTPWARVRGRAFKHRMFCFGEGVIAKQPPKGPQHDADGNMGARQCVAALIGYCRNSNAYRIVLEDGQVTTTRSLSRRPMAERWSADELSKIQSTPWDLRGAYESERVEFGESVPRDVVPEDVGPPIARRLKITMNVLQEYGYTEDCPQCEHCRAFGQNKNGLMHTEACRKRIVEAMGTFPRGVARLRDVKLRLDRAAVSASQGPEHQAEH